MNFSILLFSKIIVFASLKINRKKTRKISLHPQYMMLNIGLNIGLFFPEKVFENVNAQPVIQILKWLIFMQIYTIHTYYMPHDP